MDRGFRLNSAGALYAPAAKRPRGFGGALSQLTTRAHPQAPPPGAKSEREEWEVPFYFTAAGVAFLCVAAMTSKKPTPHAWARDEVEERERR